MMLAAHHDQENRYAHQAGAAKQPLQAKTPCARYPKTPLKVPLNDENAVRGLHGKGVLGGKGNDENGLTVGKGGNGVGKSGKLAMVTPAGPRAGRAPLGNKTTNAKAKAAYQTPGVKPLGRDIEKTTARPTSNRRLKQPAPKTEGPRLEVHTDRNPLEDEEIEYAPPRPKEITYESDVFPDGVLTFEGLKPENLFKGYYQHYFNRVDERGKTALERDMEERQKKTFERGEEQIRKDMEDFDWSIGDIPESKDMFKKKSTMAPAVSASASKAVARPPPKQPSTIASRRAASALSMPKTTSISRPRVASAAAPVPPKTQARGFILPKRKPAQPVAQPNLAARERAPTVGASRSTLGYNKGRSVSSAVHGTHRGSVSRPQSQAGPKPRPLVRSVSTASTSSDTTITPARFAQPSKEAKQPDFLAIFDADEGDEEALAGSTPPMDDEDSDFQLSLEFDDQSEL